MTDFDAGAQLDAVVAQTPITSILDLAARAMSHVLALNSWQLRADTPLAGVGADSVAVIVFGDIIEAFAARAGLPGFRIDDEQLRLAVTIGDLAAAISWDTAPAGNALPAGAVEPAVRHRSPS